MQGARSSSLRYCVGDTLPQLEFRTACELLGSPGTHNLPESPLLFDRAARVRRSRITRGPRLLLGRHEVPSCPSGSTQNEGRMHTLTHLLDGVQPRCANGRAQLVGPRPASRYNALPHVGPSARCVGPATRPRSAGPRHPRASFRSRRTGCERSSRATRDLLAVRHARAVAAARASATSPTNCCVSRRRPRAPRASRSASP